MLGSTKGTFSDKAEFVGWNPFKILHVSFHKGNIFTYLRVMRKSFVAGTCSIFKKLQKNWNKNKIWKKTFINVHFQS